jgi:hypothetical protein
MKEEIEAALDRFKEQKWKASADRARWGFDMTGSEEKGPAT